MPRELLARSGIDAAALGIRPNTVEDQSKALQRAIESAAATRAACALPATRCAAPAMAAFWSGAARPAMTARSSSTTASRTLPPEPGGSGQYGNAVNIFRAGNVIVRGNRIRNAAFSAVRGNT